MPPPILDMNNLLSILEKSFYTLPVMILLNALFLFLAFFHKFKERSVRLFILYAAASLAQDLLCIFLILANRTLIKDSATISLIDNYSIIAFIQIEFVTFYMYFYSQFQSTRVKRRISVIGKAFLLISVLASIYVCFFTSPITIGKFESCLSVTSSSLLLIPSFYYFYTLFIEPPLKNLLKEPSFWITTGIAFLHGLNIPLFFTENYFLKEFSTVWYNVYSINYIAYCFLFILFIISLLCDRDHAPLEHISITGIS